MEGDELISLQASLGAETDTAAHANPAACGVHHGACQTRRRIYYLVYGLLAAGATLLNWYLMHTSGYSIPALAVLTSMIAWVFLLGALLPFGYRSILDADVTEVGARPMTARLILTSMLALSVALAVFTCWFIGMPIVIPFAPAVE